MRADNVSNVIRDLSLGIGSLITAAIMAFAGPAAQAQDATSREVVQPLPSAQVQRLNRALLELARRPRSVAALLEAGDASLAVDDLDAAAGFYGNAVEIAPSDPRVKLGLARVYLRSGRPEEALPLLEAAQSSGAELSEILVPRALAYDLIGDQEAAQTAYALAMELTPQDDDVRRQLAISQAISGNASGFQETLAPLIEARDVAAIRARAFGLAIMGEQERAEAIVNSVMPRDLAARINPYLAYMPRLTPAQQAAAANLGIFPRAADIGREDPRIARFVSEGASGSRLEPAGEPLGSPVTQTQSEPAQQQTATALPSVPTRETESVPTVQALEEEDTLEPASVADAFAEFDIADLSKTARPQDAVDIAMLEVPREAAAEPEPAKPEHPKRIWVQLATGRDVSALGFDWRRFSRRAPDLLSDFEPHVTPWGRANRLLAGPFESSRAARQLVNGLSKKGIETFAYTSPEGTEIKQLK